VNVGDLGALATNYGTTAGALWSQGDFNYDAKVDVADLGALATNYNVALGFGAGSATVAIAEPAASTAAAIPEPASVVLIAAGALGLCLRRQRRLRVRP